MLSGLLAGSHLITLSRNFMKLANRQFHMKNYIWRSIIAWRITRAIVDKLFYTFITWCMIWINLFLEWKFDVCFSKHMNSEILGNFDRMFFYFSIACNFSEYFQGSTKSQQTTNPVFLGYRNLISLKQSCQDHFEFHLGESHSHAVSWSNAEGNPFERVLIVPVEEPATIAKLPR